MTKNCLRISKFLPHPRNVYKNKANKFQIIWTQLFKKKLQHYFGNDQ